MKKTVICILVGAIMLCFSACSSSQTVKIENNEKATVSNSTTNKANKTNDKADITSAQSQSTTTATTKANNTKKLAKGKTADNTYTNTSLGIKITAPKGWTADSNKQYAQKYGASKANNDDCTIYKITETKYGYDYKLVSVTVQKTNEANPVKSWKARMKKSCDDSEGHMEYVDQGTVTIGGRTYSKISLNYPGSPDVYVKYLITEQGNDYALIDFNQLNDDEMDNFIKNNIKEL